jgi:hypothetical protein
VPDIVSAIDELYVNESKKQNQMSNNLSMLSQLVNMGEKNAETEKVTLNSPDKTRD